MSELTDALRLNVKRARKEGFETDGAEPPGNVWARAYALDLPLLMDELLPAKDYMEELRDDRDRLLGAARELRNQLDRNAITRTDWIDDLIGKPNA